MKTYPPIHKGDKIYDWTALEDEIVGVPNILCRCKCGNENYIKKSALHRGCPKMCKKCTAIKLRKYPFIHKNDKIYDWTALEDETISERQILCRCKCGHEQRVDKNSLHRGVSRACSKCALSRSRVEQWKNYGFKRGDKLGYWTLLSRKGCHVTLQCICGTIRTMTIYNLLGGTSMSCGCRKKERFNERQLDGYNLGFKIMKKIHDAGLTPGYCNKKINKNSSTGVTGVNLMKNGRYRAYIMLDRRQIGLGSYDTLEKAAAARKDGEKKYFSGRAEKVHEIKQKMLQDARRWRIKNDGDK